MKNNFVFCVLSAVLLIEQSLGDLLPSNELTPNGKAFRNAAIAKLETLAEEPIKLGQKLYRDAIADKSNSENVTQLLTHSLRRIEMFDYKPVGNIEVFLGFNLMFDVLSGRVSITDEGIRKVILGVKEALEKHDFVGVANEFQRKFDELLEWLTIELQAKRDKLTSEEQLRVNSFKELCLEFKNETDMVKKEYALGTLVRRLRL